MGADAAINLLEPSANLGILFTNNLKKPVILYPRIGSLKLREKLRWRCCTRRAGRRPGSLAGGAHPEIAKPELCDALPGVLDTSHQKRSRDYETAEYRYQHEDADEGEGVSGSGLRMMPHDISSYRGSAAA